MNIQLTEEPDRAGRRPRRRNRAEPCRWRARRIDHRRRACRETSPANRVLKASPRGSGTPRPDDARARPTCAPSWAPRASALSRGCLTCCRPRAACPSSTAFALASQDCAPENGLEHEATIVGAFPVIAGALVQRAKGGDPIAPDPTLGHAADTLSMLLGRKAGTTRGHSARHLSRHRMRSRHERLDVHDARGGLDAGRSVRGCHRRLLRADRSAAWRRAGAGAGNAGCDRHARAHQAVGRRCAGARRDG